MNTVSRLDLQHFPESPYVAALQQGTAGPYFEPELEAQYTRSRLRQNRTLIRAASVFAVFMALLRGAEQIVEGAWNGWFLFDAELIIAASVVLIYIAWSPDFERTYLRWAPLLIPPRNAIIAAHIAAIAAHGQLEMLMLLPIMLIGPFFFLGLRFRAALVCCALTVLSYVSCAILFHLAQPVALRSYAFLLVVGVACVVAARQLETGSRLSFLEGRIIAELAQRDALTGTKNRRVFDEHLARLWQQAVEQRHALAVLLIDIDHFKAYNDRYGHQAGDQTLRAVAQSVQRFVRRPLDILARYGGEEFAVVLYDIDVDQAREVADRIRHAVGELAIEHGGSQTSSLVTISVGVAAVNPTAERNPRGALQLADQALYEAKVRGRNRVELMAGAHHSLLETGVFAVDSSRSG